MRPVIVLEWSNTTERESDGGAGGRRYGTLCVVDLKPRAFTAEMYHMLINFAELTVQEMERDSVINA